MIINKEVKTFVCLAETGSYNKASEKLYITPTAVMKHINTLEQRLDITLIIRTNQGITLTDSGKEFYTRCKKLISYSDETIADLRKFDSQNQNTLKVGSSMLNPCTPFTTEFIRRKTHLPQYKLQVIPYDDASETILSYIDKLGDLFDFMVVGVDSPAWMQKCNFFLLGTYKFNILVAYDHPLASRESIDLEDLAGYTVMMVYKGQSVSCDKARDVLSRYPEIKIKSIDHTYDVRAFNECAQTDEILFSHEGWNNIHPSLVSVPINWDLGIQYGLLYSLSPSKKLLQFLKDWARLNDEYA